MLLCSGTCMMCTLWPCALKHVIIPPVGANALPPIAVAAAGTTVKDVLVGKHCTVLCYGQTGSGKTHTMFGSTQVGAKHCLWPVHGCR